MGWLIGGMAVVANAVVIAKHLMGLVKSKTQVAFTNKALVTLIAVGDFLIGVYLLVISAFDSIFYRTGYCEVFTHDRHIIKFIFQLVSQSRITSPVHNLDHPFI